VLHNMIAAFGFGLVIASVLMLSALGFNLTYAVSEILNIGFIAFMLLGEFIALKIFESTGQLWFATLAAAAVTGVAALLLHRYLLKPFTRRGTQPFVVVLVLLGTYTLIAAGLSIVFGRGSYAFQLSHSLKRPVHIAGMLFTEIQLIACVGAILLVFLVDGVLRYTSLGRDVRAICDDRDLASNKGVRVSQITSLVWLTSGFLGGLAGVSLAVVQASFSTKGGDLYFVLLTAAAFLGGVGKPYGALAGAIVVGVMTQEAAIWVPSDLSALVAFLALIATIMFRPGGILGSSTEKVRP
jgi:neutral amino acid transport system permease protein